MSNNRHILFYSNHCVNSREFIQELYKTGLFNTFDKRCIDDPKTFIPKQITAVPTIIVPGYNQPLVGKNVFHWLENLRQRAQAQAAPASPPPRQNIAPPSQPSFQAPGATGAPSGGSPAGFELNSNNGGSSIMAGSNIFGGDEGVMPYSSTYGGYSDPFSYLGDSRPMEHSFAFLQEGGVGIGPRPNETGGIPTPDEVGMEKSEKSDEMERRLQQLKQSRDMDMPSGPPRM